MLNIKMLIVFDFHGTLSIPSGKELNDLKKRFYLGENINPYILMPTLDEIIDFVEILISDDKKYKFGIASMLEDEKFMYDVLKYCFQSKDKISPFNKEGVISSHTLNISIKLHDKTEHIFQICKNMNIPFIKTKIILIDDNKNNVKYMNSIGIKSILYSQK